MPTPEHSSTPNQAPTTYTQAELARELAEFDVDYQRDILGLDPSVITDPDAGIKAEVDKSKADREATNLPEQLNHTEQYQAQVEMLRQAGVVETLPSGAEGIIGIDGREYPIPTLEQVEAKLAERAELVETKAEQGFTKLLLVPFGMSLDKLVRKYGQALTRQADSSAGLVSSDGTSLELDKNTPVYVSYSWQGTDASGEMVYYPKDFTPDGHGGTTKSELIASGEAWQVMLVEDMVDIPANGAGQELAGRGQLEADTSPRGYLEILGSTPAYNGESGLTPEAWLTLALTRLDESGKVLDDWGGRGKVNYLLGAYNPLTGYLPFGYWARDGRQAFLVRADPGDADSVDGVRSAVRIF